MLFHPLPITPRLGLTTSAHTATSRRVLRLSKVVFFALLAAVTGFAQTPPTPPASSAPVVPPVPVTSPEPSGLPVPPVATTAEPMEKLQYINTDIRDVLAHYERITGKRLIHSTQLVGQVTIFVTGTGVPKSEAIKLMEMSLAMNGFYIVPTEDEKIMRVTGVGMNPKQVGVPFIDREELLPANDQVVMYLFKLKWADPTELAQTIQAGVLVANQAGFTNIVPLPKANALLVTESTANIRTLIRVVRAIDVEPAQVVSEFITLEHAQSEDVVKSLTDLFEKTQQQSGAPNAPRVNRGVVTDANGAPVPNIPGATAANTEGNISVEINGSTSSLGPTEDNIVIGKVKITSDKRTNRIHIVSRPINMKLIRTLIKEYDAESHFAEPALRPLRFRPVEEVMDAVIAAIKDPGDKDSGGAGGSTAQGLGQRQGQTNPAQNNNRNTNSQFGSNGGGIGGSDAGSLGESLSTSERDTQPVAQQVGKSTIIADKRSNTIIVIGTRDVKEKVFALIDKLDTRQAQVMIQVVIGELKLTKSDSFGLDFILRNGGIINNTNNPISGTGTGTTTATTGGIVGFNSANQPVLNLNGIINQQNITQALTAGSGGLSGVLLAGNAFTSDLKALESTDRFRVITSPRIFTTNNKRAVITSGDEVPVPTSINSSFNNGAATANNNIVSNSQIQFKPIELRLEVLPLINSDKEVSLEIVQNVSERAGTTRIDNNDIPNISRRALKTYVTVPNNGTLILGGLIKDSQDYNKGGINKLVNLPLIGPLFGKTSKDKTRTELIVIMRPVVTVAPPENAVLREKTFESFNIPPDFDQALIPEGIRESIPRAKTVAPPASMRSPAPKLRSEEPPTRRK